MKYALSFFLLVFCAATNAAEQLADSHIRMIATAMNTPPDGYRVGQPVWLRLSLENQSLQPITLLIDGDGLSGVNVAAAVPSRVITRLPRISLDMHPTKRVIGPLQAMTVGVLLNRFLVPKEEGKLGVRITMRTAVWRDENANYTELQADLEVSFSGRLDASNIDQFVEALRHRYRDRKAERSEIVEEVAVLEPSSRPLDILESAVRDPDETVALQAVEVLRDTPSDAARAVLILGAKDGKSKTIRDLCQRSLKSP